MDKIGVLYIWMHTFGICHCGQSHVLSLWSIELGDERKEINSNSAGTDFDAGCACNQS